MYNLHNKYINTTNVDSKHYILSVSLGEEVIFVRRAVGNRRLWSDAETMFVERNLLDVCPHAELIGNEQPVSTLLRNQ